MRKTTHKRQYSYLCGPYSHVDRNVMEKREHEHCYWAGKLLSEGHLIYSPIAETAAIARAYKHLGTAWSYWRDKDLRQLDAHDHMFIITLEGWKDSLGVRGEIKYCIKHNIPISLVEVTTGVIIPLGHKELLDVLQLDSEEKLND